MKSDGHIAAKKLGEIMGEDIKMDKQQNNNILKGLLSRKGMSNNSKRGQENVVRKRLKNFFTQKFMSKLQDECCQYQGVKFQPV